MNGLAGFTNAFLLLYGLDAGFSLFEELFRLATGSTALLGPRNLLAFPVVLAALGGFPCLVISPALPARLLVPLFVSVLWLNWGAAPLAMFLAPPALGFAATAIQCGAALIAFSWVRRQNARRGEASSWWLGDPAAPPFSASHSLRMLLLYGFVLLPAFGLYGVLLFATTVQVATREFVTFDREGISLADRRYEREGQKLRLVGMMHIGEASNYREVVESFVAPGTIVLEEGVTDTTGVMSETLAYDGVASVLGLDAQDELSEYLRESEEAPLPEWPVFRHADVDLETFSPKTIEWLGYTQEIWAGEDWLAALRQILTKAGEDPELAKAIEWDLFTQRNAQLLEHIAEAQGEFETVVVPWGALHLPAIERQILADGYEPAGEVRRRLVDWETVSEALARRNAVKDEEAAGPDSDVDGPPDA